MSARATAPAALLGALVALLVCVAGTMACGVAWPAAVPLVVPGPAPCAANTAGAVAAAALPSWAAAPTGFDVCDCITLLTTMVASVPITVKAAINASQSGTDLVRRMAASMSELREKEPT